MSIRDLVFIALFAAFIIVLGLIPAIAIPVLPGVLITMQGIGFMLAGALLGWKRGFLCAVVIWARWAWRVCWANSGLFIWQWLWRGTDWVFV